MRMTASWRDLCGRPNTSSRRATRARWRAPLGNVAVVETELNERDTPCRPTDYARRCARARQGKAASRWPSAALDGHCAQRPQKIRSGRGDVAGRSNKEMLGHDGLDTNRLIQVLGRIARLAEVASGRTGVRAIAVIPLRARNRLHRPKRKTLPRIEAAFARIATAHSSGIPALRRPSYVRSFTSTKRGSPPCSGRSGAPSMPRSS